MKSLLLATALPVLLLTGCAGTGYYGYDNGPGYPGYYDGGYYGGPAIDVGFYGYGHGDYYHHGYHHYDTGSRGTVAYHGSSHVGGRAFASVGHSSGHSGGSHGTSVSSGAAHIH